MSKITEPVDVFARQIHDQILAAAACDDDRQCAAYLRTLAKYLETKELQIKQTAWDPERAVPIPTITARYDGRCSSCGGPVRVGDAIIYDGETKRTVHAKCGGGAC